MKRSEATREIARVSKAKYLRDPFNRYKHTARALVSSAVECGILNKSPHCEQCSSVGTVEGHHEDYLKPLEIEWLCERCHSKRHLKTHCKRGHEFSPENTQVTAIGRRCRTCSAMHTRMCKARKLSAGVLAEAETSLASAREILRGEVR